MISAGVLVLVNYFLFQIMGVPRCNDVICMIKEYEADMKKTWGQEKRTSTIKMLVQHMHIEIRTLSLGWWDHCCCSYANNTEGVFAATGSRQLRRLLMVMTY
jgi:hypothetical protein